MKNKIDVIICTNKRLLGLKKLIHQILNQKGFFDFRIILIHQSKFRPILPNFLNSKKIIYKNIKKQNLSLAKNKGLSMSTSKFVTFLDDDVQINNKYFSYSLKYIKRKNCDLLFSRINQINSNLPLSRNMKNLDIKINYFNTGCCLSSSMWINFNNIKKKYFDKNFGLGAKFGSGEETDYIFSYLKNNRCIHYSSEPLIYHPKEFFELQNFSKIYAKFISYGKGQGAIMKKNLYDKNFLFIYLFTTSLLKSFFVMIFYTLIFNIKKSIKYFALFIGKILGFANYKIN